MSIRLLLFLLLYTLLYGGLAAPFAVFAEQWFCVFKNNSIRLLYPSNEYSCIWLCSECVRLNDMRTQLKFICSGYLTKEATTKPLISENHKITHTRTYASLVLEWPDRRMQPRKNKTRTLTHSRGRWKKNPVQKPHNYNLLKSINGRKSIYFNFSVNAAAGDQR